MNANSIIMGIDPGTIVTGYGIIKLEGNNYVPLDYGCIRPPSKHKLTDRYLIIFNAIENLINTYAPEVLVVESQFINAKKNIQSILKLGMARGVIIAAAKRKNMAVFEYAPTQAKMAVVGKGHASKFQVQSMTQNLLKLKSLPPEDAADALALALCHTHTIQRGLKCGSEI